MRKVVWVILILFAIQAFPADQDDYISPMECKKLHFDQPGTCPVCGMELVKRVAFRKNDKRKQVAILIFDGVQIIDFSAPYEVLGQAGFKVVTVAEKKDPVTTSMNMTVTPDYDFKEVLTPDILVVPGGNVDNAVNSAATIAWVKKHSANAQYVLSVCNGAFILAKSGLLDGLSATTFYGLLDDFARVAPKTKVVRDRRFVDNGKVITTAGLTSGMDGSSLGKDVRNFLVVSEVALAVLLLIGAGLLARSFQRIQNVPLGFVPEQRVAMRIALPRLKYDGEKTWQFSKTLLERIEAIPSVSSAALTSDIPLEGSSSASILNLQDKVIDRGVRVYVHAVNPKFFSTTGIPLKAGRPFQSIDTPDSLPVAIVSEKMVQRYWRNENPLGKRVKFGRAPTEE